MKRLRSNLNLWEAWIEEISCELGNASQAKTLFFRILKQNQVRESALLGPQVKLRFDWKYDRWGQVSSCHIGSLQSFRTSGLPPINTPPPPSLAGWLLQDWFPAEEREREQPHRSTSQTHPPKHKSYWSELIHYDLGRSLLAFLSWRTAILLDG